MAIGTEQGEDRAAVSIPTEVPTLDLSSDPWLLTSGQASAVRNVNILGVRGIHPAPPRSPLGVSSPDASTITKAWGIDLYGMTAVRYRDLYIPAQYAGTTTTLKKQFTPYAWPSAMVGGYLYQNADGRQGPAKLARITSITTTTNTDDTLNFAPAVDTWLVNEDKFSILYSQLFDKRGILVTNGRKFWLLQAGAYSLYLDLGTGVDLGSEWSVSRIASNLILLVSPKYPARVLRLSDSSISAESGNESIAGLISPIKPYQNETSGDDDGNTNKSWTATANSAGGSLDASTDYRIKIRAVNLEDGSESAFVNVYDASDLDDRDCPIGATGTSTNTLRVQSPMNNSATERCPFHSRWTHLEIWRTTDGPGSQYYRETQIEIAREENELVGNVYNLIEESPPGQMTCSIADGDLTGLALMSATDLLAGNLPPLCRGVASLLGVTICAGAADETRSDITAYSRNFEIETGNRSATAVTKTALFTNYTFEAGDVLVVTAPAGVAGSYGIVSRSSADTIVIDTDIGSGSLDVYGYIRKAYSIECPYIESDEHVWHSRTDTFAPESFLRSPVVLSRTGDTFRGLIAIGQYVVAVMSEGVHLLYLSDGEIAIDTISAAGDGTPWKDSIVGYGNMLFWAHPTGPKMLTANKYPNDAGHLATITYMPGASNVRKWFEDSERLGYTIDAGVDTLNATVIFRRQKSANEYEALQFSVQTGKWCQLDDVTGVAFARSMYADASVQDQAHLYSVDASGNVFEENCLDLTHPYDSATTQATASVANGYTVTTTSITKNGTFSASMLGDVVRFYSSTVSAVDGVIRRITSASANAIGFATVTGLAAGVEFCVGAPPVRIRYASFRPGEPDGMVNLDGAIVRALPGVRNTDGGWPSTVPGSIRLRAYRDYADTPLEQTYGDSVSVFLSEDASKLTENRAVGIEGDGNALELELYCDDAKTDFRVELLTPKLRGASDPISDAEA